MVCLLLLASFLIGMDYNPKLQGTLAVVSVLLFIAGYAISLGSVCWVIMTEVVPHQLRDKAYSVFMNTSWLCVLVTSLGTLEGVLLLICCCGFVMLWFRMIAIDGLGGMHGGLSDEEKDLAQKHGVALLYFVLFGTLRGVS